MEGEDLMGWLIPEDKSDVFEPLWKDDSVSDDWSEYYVWAVWSNEKKVIVNFVEFE